MTPTPALVARYRTRAPRYTSYPTAPHFLPLEGAVVDAALGRGAGPVSLYVHIPFCRSLCTYCGCHVEIRRNRDVGANYVDALLAELDLWCARLRSGRPLDQLALGGGTPTFLRPTDMRRLVDGIRLRLASTSTIDASIEIDPRTVDDNYLETLVACGFNRFSFGVQDLDPGVLDAVNRPQSAETVHNCLATLRRHGDFDINLDLMYGLPGQVPQGFASTVDAVATLRPTRIALFHYAHVPWLKPAQKLLEPKGLPDSAVKSQLFDIADTGLRSAGYLVVGMDHFALPGDELIEAQAKGTLQRNFMGYTTRGGLDQLGIGVSAIGSFGGVYAQDIKEREAWNESVSRGALPVSRGFALSTDDLARRAVIMDLFCNFHVRHEAGAWAEERERLAPMAADGLVRLEEGGIQVTPLGRHFVRNVCAVFDRYLEPEPGQRRYSETA